MPADMTDEEKIQAATEVVAKTLFEGDTPPATRAAVAYLIGRFLADINDIACSLGCISSIMIEQSEAMEDEAYAASRLHDTEPKGSA